MEKPKVRKLVITLESFSSSAIETQASLLPIPPNPQSQVLCLPLIPPQPSASSPCKHFTTQDVAQLDDLEQLPELTIQYILSLRDQWLARLAVCIKNLVADVDGETDSPSHRVQEKVVFMLGGTTGVRFACVKKIAEDVTDGDIALAHDVFLRVESRWKDRFPGANEEGRKGDNSGAFQLSTASPTSPITQYPSDPPPLSTTTISNPTLGPTLAPRSRQISVDEIQADKFEGLRSPQSTESFPTATHSPCESRIPTSKAYNPEYDQESETTSPLESRQFNLAPRVEKCRLKRPSSLIIFPSSAQSGGITASVTSRRRTSLDNIRENGHTSPSLSWYEPPDLRTNNPASEDSSHSTKEAKTDSKLPDGSLVDTIEEMEIEESGGQLPNLKNDGTYDSHCYGSEPISLRPSGGGNQFSSDTIRGAHASWSAGATRLSWLAPPTTGGELEQTPGPSQQLLHEHPEIAVLRGASEDLFPSLLSILQTFCGYDLMEKELYQGILYLDADTPRVQMERVVYDWLFAESVSDKAPQDGSKRFQQYQLPYSSPGVCFPPESSSDAQSYRESPARFESIPLFQSAFQIRRVKLTGKKRKNGIEIQNELRSFVRELMQTTLSYKGEYENLFSQYVEESTGAIFEVDDEEEETTVSIWRDMFSTQGEWPLSTVNLIVALGREGPTNTVKGGSGRLITEAMARRLESWDLRCRRISLRYLLYLARRNGHLGNSTIRPPPRQLIAELEFFLSLHEPTDLLILEFNTTNREETEAVLELSVLLGRVSHRPSSDRDGSTMLRMACVFSGEVPRGLDIHGIIVGNSPDFAASNTRTESTPFEGFRFPTCRSPGYDKQKHRMISTTVQSLITVADLVVEDTGTEKESPGQRHHSMPLEIQLEHVFSVLDHWTAVARLRPAPSCTFQISRSTSPTPYSKSRPPSQQSSPVQSKPECCITDSPSPTKPGRKRSASRPLLEVIVTAFSGVEGKGASKQELLPLTTHRGVLSQSFSGRTFLDNATDEAISSEDDFDLGINGFQPSIGIIEAHEQSDTEFEEEEVREDSVDDYDMVVAMQYASKSVPRVSRKLSTSRRKRTQVWFRSKKKRKEPKTGKGIPALKRMHIMRLGSSCIPGGRALHGKARSKDTKGQLRLVLVSNKAMKLLGLERSTRSS